MPAEKFVVHVIDDDEASRQSLAFLLQTARIEAKTYASAAFSSICFRIWVRAASSPTCGCRA